MTRDGLPRYTGRINVPPYVGGPSDEHILKRRYKMKLAVRSTGKDLNAPIDPRFGRCAYFVIVETDDMSFEVFDNENNALSGGAGIQSASFIASKNVAAVLTGNCGPNAIKTLSAGGVQVYTGQTGTVLEAIQRYQKGALQPSVEATVPEKAGVNSAETNPNAQPQAVNPYADGFGRGMGGGGCGRGMGGGRSRGRGGCGRGMGGGGRGMGGGWNR